MLDITTTACIRPDILRQTFSSFKQNLLRDFPCRLIINIDPVGDDVKQQAVLDVCCDYFDTVVCRMPEKPNFPAAFLWCWRQVKSDYVLHLEDDWELLRSVPYPDMIAELDRQPNLALLRLSAFRSGTHNMKCWNKFLDWNGSFFEVAEQDRRRIGFCGHPSIIKADWIRRVLPHMNAEKNPEKQLQFPEYNGLDMLKEILSWRYGVWSGQEQEAAVKDLGRDWISNTQWRKRGNRSYFTEWERQA